MWTRFAAFITTLYMKDTTKYLNTKQLLFNARTESFHPPQLAIARCRRPCRGVDAARIVDLERGVAAPATKRAVTLGQHLHAPQFFFTHATQLSLHNTTAATTANLLSVKPSLFFGYVSVSGPSTRLRFCGCPLSGKNRTPTHTS